MQPDQLQNPKDVHENKDLAALGYVWILSIVVLFARRSSGFVQFHAKQGTVLLVLSLIVWPIPFVGAVLELLILGLCVAGFMNAAQGQWRELPLVGPIARGSMTDMRKGWRDIVDTIASTWRGAKASSMPTSSPPSVPEPPPPPPPQP